VSGLSVSSVNRQGTSRMRTVVSSEHRWLKKKNTALATALIETPNAQMCDLIDTSSIRSSAIVQMGAQNGLFTVISNTSV
jgi:hypothetical protein